MDDVEIANLTFGFALRLCDFAGYSFAMNENQIAQEIVDSAFKIHVEIGPGLLESVYEAVLDSRTGASRIHCGEAAWDTRHL